MGPPTRVLITGANGRLGRRLIRRLSGIAQVRAVVRSEAARRQVMEAAAGGGVECVVLDYADVAALTSAAKGCSHAVHLVGIIKESASTSFVDAHERSTRALADAARSSGVDRLLYLSILGAEANHPNPCLASKGRAGALLVEVHPSALVLRVPMVLGEGDPATHALEARARARLALLFRGSSLEQPIYSNDVVEALVKALDASVGVGALDLAGPESLSRSSLVRRAAAVLGTRPTIVSLPLAIGMGAAFVLERVSANPPVSRAMLGVLDHDDAIDPTESSKRLGVALTPLDEMLERCLRPPASTEPVRRAP